MENEYLNPGFKNYILEPTSEKYIFMNEETAPIGAKVEKMDALKMIADEEEAENKDVLKVMNIVKKIDQEKSNKLIFGMVTAIFTLGAITSLLINKDLTNSIVDEITNLGSYDKFKEVIKSFSIGNIITITGSAISWNKFLKHKKLKNVYEQDLADEKQRINYLEINGAIEKNTEGRPR